MFTKLFKKLTGLDKLEKSIQELEEKELAIAQVLADKIEETKVAQQEAEKAKATPKERATADQKPYIAVLDTHVNPENPRNGFFELDWNEYFIVQLKQAGYTGENEEAIVDAWFKELCADVAGEEQIDMSRRGVGYINVNNLGNGKSEIS